MFFSKRKRIIKKAVNNTVATLSSRTPKIYEYFFYGAFDISPKNLVIWYLFETYEELEIAKTSGLCAELEELTIKNLISSGYPQEAFNDLSDRKAMVSFTTQEDINRKTDGDYRLYFQ